MFPLVPLAIKPAIRNCVMYTGARGHEIPEINDTQRYGEKFGCCGTNRVLKISAAVRRDRKTFRFWQRARRDRRAACPGSSLITAPSINRSRHERRAAERGWERESGLQSGTRDGKLESAREVKHTEIRESKIIAC